MMPRRAWIYLLGCNVLFGSAFVATVYALRGFTVWGTAFWRLFLSAFFLVPVLWRAWRPGLIGRTDWARIVAAGLVGMTAGMITGTAALRYTTATNAVLLRSFEPLATFLLAAVFLGEALTTVKVGAIFCGFFGAALVVLQGLPWSARPSAHWRGDLLILLCAILWAAYTMLAKSAFKRVSPLVFTALTTMIAVVPVGLAAGRAVWPAVSPPLESVAWLLFLALGVSLGGILMWNKGLELVPASTMAQFLFLQPLIGAVLGAALLGEPFTAWTVGGGAFIVAGVALAVRGLDGSRLGARVRP